jgi:hypothetical protein
MINIRQKVTEFTSPFLNPFACNSTHLLPEISHLFRISHGGNNLMAATAKSEGGFQTDSPTCSSYQYSFHGSFWLSC